MPEIQLNIHSTVGEPITDTSPLLGRYTRAKELLTKSFPHEAETLFKTERLSVRSTLFPFIYHLQLRNPGHIKVSWLPFPWLPFRIHFYVGYLCVRYQGNSTNGWVYYMIPLPDEDEILSFLLYLKQDEKELLKRINFMWASGLNRIFNGYVGSTTAFFLFQAMHHHLSLLHVLWWV